LRISEVEIKELRKQDLCCDCLDSIAWTNVFKILPNMRMEDEEKVIGRISELEGLANRGIAIRTHHPQASRSVPFNPQPVVQYIRAKRTDSIDKSERLGRRNSWRQSVHVRGAVSMAPQAGRGPSTSPDILAT
jgi:hypothetical protein